MADPKPLLSLTTLTEFPTIAIDGERYALTPAEAIDVVQAFKLDVLRGRINALAPQVQSGDLSADAGADAEAAIDELVRIVLVAPTAVIDQLTTIQKLAITQAFFELPQTTALAAVAQRRATCPRTGANSPRASRGSTAAIRSAGSRASRSRSSAPVS